MLVKIFLSAILFFISHFSYATIEEHDVEDDDEIGKASLIIDNTAGPVDQVGVKTNYQTGLTTGAANAMNICDKTDALNHNDCNSFNLGPNSLQVVQRQQNGSKLSLEVGAFNNKSTSYNNEATNERLNLFDPGKHVVDLDRLRNAANILALRQTSLPPFTYGTITWQQFIKNVAEGKTMYGIVRVKIPLQQITEAPRAGEENKYRSRSGKRYQLCGRKKESKCGCGPGKDDDNDGEFEATNIKPGATICGVKIPRTAQINVLGSIMFDWVDCDKDGLPPLELDDLPESPRDIIFKVSVPINVNPADPRDGDGAMKNIDNIASLWTDKGCTSASGCAYTIDKSLAIPFAWVSEQSKNEFFYNTGKVLTETTFLSLPIADRYNLLNPSGYEKGLAEAFRKLGITHEYWQEKLGYRSNINKNSEKYRSVINENDIRSNQFEDIPTYIYTGGLVDMHFHVNISGLVYVPQALELEQKGQTLEKRVAIIDAEYGHHSKEYSSSKNIADDFHDHEFKSCKKQSEHYEQHISAKQYISGAILVRDAFYIEAEHPGGVTIVSHNPKSYDQIVLNSSTSAASKFRPFKRQSDNDANSSTISIENNGDSNENSSGGNNSNNSGGNSNDNIGGSSNTGTTTSGNSNSRSNSRGPQWVEIKPRVN